MTLKIKLSLILLLITQLVPRAAIHIDIRQFGALNDGKTLNTLKIQSAIDSCFAARAGADVVELGSQRFLEDPPVAEMYIELVDYEHYFSDPMSTRARAVDLA